MKGLNRINIQDTRLRTGASLVTWQFAFFALTCLLIPYGTVNAGQIAISNVNVVDVESGTLLTEQTVVAASGRVVAIGANDAVSIPEQFRHIDGTDKFLIPGLWDMHVHLPVKAPELTMPLFIANGVTGVREMGGFSSYERKVDWQTRINEGSLQGPRILGVVHSVITSLATEEEARAAAGLDQEEGGDQSIQSITSRTLFCAARRSRPQWSDGGRTSTTSCGCHRRCPSGAKKF